VKEDDGDRETGNVEVRANRVIAVKSAPNAGGNAASKQNGKSEP
jgi:hypothetical protein